ncbi:unnamed protein product (macronuclear) [Paramecium tetraurelia]|uniref:RRM domain-containing protein n=1 Tax=Paramecium tetraurelia TaxID=5888 RepID=A0DEM8_PARTE|nr:uncharacterized protein GSPATT00016321001 [Paramecium tetraurelia]CAK81495.1 unnamed protein product [Paramecium tetraurelia]|eukprot:XP_001448892.1 hypothetical protein (macronuclear) [Paramecium tetraurelia strain d4-2]
MNNYSRDPPSKILLLVITQLSPTFPLCNDLLFEQFAKYGDIKKILIFERGKANKAFVEYYDVKHAIEARKDKLGKYLAEGEGKLTIHFSRLKNLDLEVVDKSRGTDYTQASSTNSDTMKHSNTDDPNVLRQQIESFTRTFTQTSQRNLTPARNDEINNLLNSDSDDDIDIWKQQKQQGPQISQDVQNMITQKPSKIIKVTSIDDRVTAKMLYNIFNKFGNVEELLYEKQMQRVFVRYQTIEFAQIAKEYLNNIQFFDQQWRISYHPLQQLQPTTISDEYMIYYNPNGPKLIVPLSKTIILSGVIEAMEISEMMRLVAKVLEIKIVASDSLEITMMNISETLKIIAVFSDYEYKNQKLIISIK